MEGNYLNRNTHREDSLGYEEHTWGISTSWPARNYACSFCKREFRSAQALGGHMNVHRRDRARLRSSLSSWVSDQCPKPNNPATTTNYKPNNNNPTFLSPSPLLSDHELLNYAQPSSPPLYSPCSLTLSSSSPSPAPTNEDKKPIRFTPYSQYFPSHQRREVMMSAFGVEEMKGYEVEEHKVFKNNNEQNITLELGIGLLQHQEEKLDLELRL